MIPYFRWNYRPSDEDRSIDLIFYCCWWYLVGFFRRTAAPSSGFQWPNSSQAEMSNDFVPSVSIMFLIRLSLDIGWDGL